MKKVFNWSELHLSEKTSYKIHTLVVLAFKFSNKPTIKLLSYSKKNSVLFSLSMQQITIDRIGNSNE
jgi:hypothetical protein